MRILLIFSLSFEIIFSINPKLSEKRLPSCDKPDDSNVNWFSCGLDSSKWYGITKKKLNVTEAQHVCQAANSKLLYIENEADDICAYYAMTLSQKDDALVLFSGRYFSAVDEWGWCPDYSRGTSLEDGCVGMISNYENWISSADLEGDCMGGFIDTSGSKESENFCGKHLGGKHLRGKHM